MSRSRFAFIPDRSDASQDWASIVYGLRWLERCGKWIGTTPEPAFDYESAVLSYIRLTISIGGVPGFAWTGVDVPGGVVLLGDRSMLMDVARALAEHAGQIEPVLFLRSLKRGIWFHPLPG